mmetsp:Transcript_14730/g.21038  ORF Transcript_14730/g.21038 Transcript_14730/m.21038 type:complete len:84 (+) Transcript_14730:1000-1251(+)
MFVLKHILSKREAIVAHKTSEEKSASHSSMNITHKWLEFFEQNLTAEKNIFFNSIAASVSEAPKERISEPRTDSNFVWQLSLS